MRKIAAFLFLASIFCSSLFAQTCASPFAAGNTPFTEICNPSGPAGPYSILVTATSDSALSFVGLWEVPTTVILADVDCQTQTFLIPRQTIYQNFQIKGFGIYGLPTVTVNYSIFQDSIATTPIDSCVGVYQGVVVGVARALQESFQLFPNPTTTSTQLRMIGDATAGTWTYRVLDMDGRDVYVGTLDSAMQATIDTQRMARGMYRVVVQSSDGQLGSKVLVVQ